MTIKFSDVFINHSVTIAGPFEKNGPLGNLFDKTYDDLYMFQKTWEQAEMRILEESVSMLLEKAEKKETEINLHISGELSNQITATNFSASKLGIPLLGVFSACATSCESLILGASLLEGGLIKNCICSTSSHNNAAEKQFRYPVEYGGPKPDTATFTTTGGVSAYLSTKKIGVRIESGTIGSVQDMQITDPYHMGAVMAPAAAHTIHRHLTDMNRDASYYDLILTGDLGVYGKEIVKEHLQEEYKLTINNIEDSGLLIFDREKQSVYAGASGPACIPLVTYSYIFNQMKQGKLKKVLLVATGALLSQVTPLQKLSIPSIAHAVSLEVVE